MKMNRMLPSPAMVVAVLALIAALAGGAYAALSKNSVGTKQLKKGAVKTVDIRRNAVTGKKAKESTFGTVPSAQVANSFGGMTATRVDQFTLGNGGSRTIGTFGPFTLTATCSLNEGGTTDFARILITASENNLAFKGEDENSDFDIGETTLYVEASGAPTGTAAFQEDGGAAIAPSGFQMLGHQLYAGVNTFGQPGICRFGGVLFTG